MYVHRVGSTSGPVGMPRRDSKELANCFFQGNTIVTNKKRVIQVKTPIHRKSVAILRLATLLFTIAGLLPSVASADAQTAPSVLNISTSAPNGSYPAGATIPVTLTFSSPVTVNGSPILQLNSGVSASAVYAAGSGTAVLTFNYIVAPGDSSSLLDYSSSTALSANGGTIQDSTTSADASSYPAVAGRRGFVKRRITA